MSLEEFKYFFSYTRKDSEFVLKLAKELRAVGANLWLDQLDVVGGQHWDLTVEEALKSCKGMIAVLSPESVVSKNVMDEVSYALDEEKLVVPVLIRSCNIPFRLRRVQYIDFTADYDTGFSQLLRALRIEQSIQPPESAATQEPVVQDSTEPLEAKPTKPLVYEKQAAQEVEEPLLPKVSEPTPDELDQPKPTGLKTEKAGSKSRMAKVLAAICIVTLITIVSIGVFIKYRPSTDPQKRINNWVLNVIPKSIENLENLVEKEGKWDWANIPKTIIDRRYDPHAASAMLGAWESFGENIKKDLNKEKDLEKQYAAADRTYTTYRDKFLRYWFYIVPDCVIEGKAKFDSQQYENVVATSVMAELLVGLGEPLETVLAELRKYNVPFDNNDIQLFEKSLIKVKQNKDDTINTFQRVLDNWIELKGNAETKRRTLLSMRPAAFRDNYAPFSYQSPAQFVDMYVVKLACNLLHKLTLQVQSGETEALNELRKHSSKFPFDPGSKDDLKETDFTNVRLLFDKTHSQRSFPDGTIGSGEKTRIDEVDTELKQLQEPLVESQKRLVELEQIEQIFGGLPKSGNLCYCRIKLLCQTTQRSLLPRGEETLFDYLTELRFVQGSQQSERFNTRSRNDLNICMVTYPGPQLQVEFYQYPSSTEPSRVLTFSEPWACLRMLKQSFDSQKKGYIRLNVDSKDDNLGGILYLQLEFFNDRDCKQPVDSNFIEAMTGQKLVLGQSLKQQALILGEEII